MPIRRIGWFMLFGSLVIGADHLPAQESKDWNIAQVYVTRQDLMDMLERLESVSQSAAYSDNERDQSRMEAELVRSRLEQGDFKTGDRIVMSVEAEPALTDTFTVHAGPAITLPDLGEVSLNGILRAELDDHLTMFIRRFIRNPSVQARPLVPITVIGGVTSPGFYTVPTDALFTDALTFAGGPTATAKINEITVQRGGILLYDEQYIARAIVEGRTIDGLGLQSGDQIIVPAPQPGGGILRVVTILGAIVAIPAAIFTITR